MHKISTKYFYGSGAYENTIFYGKTLNHHGAYKKMSVVNQKNFAVISIQYHVWYDLLHIFLVLKCRVTLLWNLITLLN